MHYLQEELYQKVEEDDLVFELVRTGGLDGMWYWDLEHPKHIWLSSRLWQTLGYQPTIMQHSEEEWRRVIDPDDLKQLLASLALQIESPDLPLDLVVRYTHANGSIVWMRCQCMKIRNAQGRVRRLLGVQVDVTQQQQNKQTVAQHQQESLDPLALPQFSNGKAEHDLLTGIPGRALFMAQLRRSTARAQRHHHQLVLYCIDVDQLQQINERYGHFAGDIVLRELASRLSSNLRQSDFCARLSDDEFVILVEADDPVTKGMQLAPLLLEKLAQRVFIGELAINASVSIGIAHFPECAKTADELLRYADCAMRQAKQLGGNQFRLYSGQLHQQVLRVQQLKQGLAGARSAQQLYLEYQPIFDTRGQLEGFEALLRWQYDGELIPPAEFITVAEEYGFISSIGDWVLHQAIEQLARWTDSHQFHGYVAINLSLLQLRNPFLASQLKALVDRHGIEPRRVHLEITETQLTDNFDRFLTDLKRLHEIGFAISLDDFGTGYAAFRQLRQHPINTLKIDRSYLQGVPENGVQAEALKTLFSLADILHLSVVVEGVETAQQAQWLDQYQCAQQGFYHARPGTSQQAVALM